MHQIKVKFDDARRLMNAMRDNLNHKDYHFASELNFEENWALLENKIETIEVYNAKQKKLRAQAASTTNRAFADIYAGLDLVIFNVHQDSKEVRAVWAFSIDKLGVALEVGLANGANAQDAATKYENLGLFGDYIYMGEGGALDDRGMLEARNKDVATDDQVESLSVKLEALEGNPLHQSRQPDDAATREAARRERFRVAMEEQTRLHEANEVQRKAEESARRLADAARKPGE